MAQEELEKVKEQRRVLNEDIENMKQELFNYLKIMKQKDSIKVANNLEDESNFYELKHTIIEQRTLLDSLNDEIITKKKEIDILRDRSENYVQQFRNEVENHENSILVIQSKKQELATELNELKQRLEEVSNEIKQKTQVLNEKTNGIEVIEQSISRMQMLRDEEAKNLNK